MNDYFCSIGNDLASKIPDKPNPLLNGDYSVNMNGAAFCFKEINPQDVSKAISEFKSSMSFGVDMISIYFLKITLPYIYLPLAFIFNASIRACKFPDAWKFARVTPIYKDGEKNQRSNYRTISVLPVVSRLFEKIVFQQFYDYLNSNKLLSSDQSGFRALHSTVSS